jgi:hypothetical protein
MGLGEADTRAKLIDPALHARGWTEELIRREETAGAIEIVGGRPRKRSRGRVDYVLRVQVNPGTQPVALALAGHHCTPGKRAYAQSVPPRAVGWGHSLDSLAGHSRIGRQGSMGDLRIHQRGGYRQFFGADSAS